MSAFDGHLEPPAILAGDHPAMSLHEIATLSAAISLKRIADTLDGTNGLPLWQAIEQAIGTGMFHGFQNAQR